MQRQIEFHTNKRYKRDFSEHLAPGTFAYENENIRFIHQKRNTLSPCVMKEVHCLNQLHGIKSFI